MASLDGQLIDLKKLHSGMAGVLSSPSPVTTAVLIENMSVVFQQGSSAVVVGLQEKDADSVLERGYAALQQALDILALSEHVELSFDDLIHRHLLWWREPGSGLVARWSGCAQTRIRTTASWVVTHHDGSTERSTDPERPAWAEALRYFRKSQNAASAGDAYRDMYLALEQAMSFALPHTTGGDGAWTRAALVELRALGVQLEVFATGAPDPVDAFMERFYASRNGHNHAKAGKDHVIPHDLAHHEKVLDDLSWLGQLVLHTFFVLGWDQIQPGGMVLSGIRLLNESMDLQLAVTEDDTIVRPEDVVVSPIGRGTHRLETKAVGSVDTAGFDFGWLGRIQVQDLTSPSVGRAAAGFLPEGATDIEPFAVENPPKLEVDGFDVLEYRFVHVHAAVFGRVRRHYPS